MTALDRLLPDPQPCDECYGPHGLDECPRCKRARKLASIVMVLRGGVALAALQTQTIGDTTMPTNVALEMCRVADEAERIALVDSAGNVSCWGNIARKDP